MKVFIPREFTPNSKTDYFADFIYYDESGDPIDKANVIFEYAQVDASTVEVYILFALDEFKDQVHEAIKTRIVKTIHWTGEIIFTWL